MGTQLLPHGKGHSSPHFSAQFYCIQTAGWMRIPLGKDVGLGWAHVLDGNPVPPSLKGAHFLYFSAHVCCGQTVAHFSNCRALVTAVKSRALDNADILLSSLDTSTGMILHANVLLCERCISFCNRVFSFVSLCFNRVLCVCQ